MSEHQEPKYEFRDGHVFNRASGEVVPDDEPVMVFRARDKHAAAMIEYYARLIEDDEHKVAVYHRLYQFMRFATEHPDRMKEPDTDLGQAR